MYLLVKHITSFRYDNPVSETVMEVRKRPRDDEGQQSCLSFDLDTHPRSHIHSFEDHLGNHVHHFDLPSVHRSVDIVTETTVRMTERVTPEACGGGGSSAQLQAATRSGEFYDWLSDSQYVHASDLVHSFVQSLNFKKDASPLELASQVSETIYQRFEYKPNSTNVDSPIDTALKLGAGVCQDFSHLMIAACRLLGVPARYVSGYLHHRAGDNTRSAEDASHAWVEVWLPTYGWLGFDPTNNCREGTHHIRVAIGRDYADVAPTRGVYRGNATETLSVAVNVFEIPEPMAQPVRPSWEKSQDASAKLEQLNPLKLQDQ